MDQNQSEKIIVHCKEKNTFCLNMIVKNEAHVIEKTLNKLLEKIQIDYWVISDTGSTDGTQDIIKNFFDNKKIDGELHEDVWKDFGYNRTQALKYAFEKSDYLLIFDADDELAGNFVLPKLLYADAYNFLFKTPSGVYYNRPLLIKNNRKWKFKGILHEHLALCDIDAVKRKAIYANIDGDYYVISGKHGDRSKNQYKYLIDALKLEAAYLEEQEQEMKERYAFYCANSYRDYAEYLQICSVNNITHEKNVMNKDFETTEKYILCYEKAIEWYKKILGFNNWGQEKYIACLRIYRCYCKLNKKVEGIPYLVEAYKFDPQRVECITELIIHYVMNEMYDIAFAYYSLVSQIFENENFVWSIHEKLFMEVPVYYFILPHFMIVVCDRIKRYDISKKMFRKIFTGKIKAMSKDVNCVLYNLQTVVDKSENMGEEKDKEFNMLAKSYIQFLRDNGYDVDQCNCLHLYEKYGIVESVKQESILDINSGSDTDTDTDTKTDTNTKKILFYTGYTDKKWNLSQSLCESLGGSERAVIHLAQSKSLKKYQVYITGTVENETQDNIHFVDLNGLPKLLENNYFSAIIVSRYVSFFELYKFKSERVFVWAHDTALINYGCSTSTGKILEKWNQNIDGYVCLTERQKELFERIYPMIYGKINVINNGIDLTLFEKNTKTRIKNSFVFSSRSERGLARLLELWSTIIEKYPDARLNICSYVDFPKTQDDILMQGIIDQYKDSIKHHGKLNQKQLYDLMANSEYWLHPSHWPETSCITGMEILKSGVTPIYYPIAGLPETIGNLGFPCRDGNEIDVLENLSEQNKEYMRNRGYEHADTCSWDQRSKKWETLLFKEYNTIKIVNLVRRPDRKNAMIQKLNTIGITNYEFIEAVDGKKVELTPELKKMFVGNDFDDKKGVIGCALSHYKLLQQLVDDPDNNYYVIIEDDVVFADDFAEKIKLCCLHFVKHQIEYLFIGALFINKKNTQINDLQFILGKNLHFGGTYAYIVSKNAAKKIINYIELNGIRHAIDNPMIYKSLNSIYHLNEWIVYSDSFQLHNNLDTDIQTDTDRFDFSLVRLPEKETKYNNKGSCNISFCDFWVYEYSGGSFDPNDNFLINLIRKYSDGIAINLTEPSHNSDVIIFSLFGKTNYKYMDQRRVFFSGEATPICQDADYNITFNYDADNNCRLPLWICYMDDNLVHQSNKRKQGIYDIPQDRKKFCSFICGNPGVKNNRKIMVEKISEYKKVDSGGYFMNNIGYVVPRGVNCSGKIEHNNNYKFAIAFENTDMNGYCTEKICDAFKSNCIPIYWGTKDIVKDFNPNCFINVNDFDNLDDLNKWIQKVDQDPEIYASYFKEQIFSDYWMNIFNDPDQKFYKTLVKKIICNA